MKRLFKKTLIYLLVATTFLPTWAVTGVFSVERALAAVSVSGGSSTSTVSGSGDPVALDNLVIGTSENGDFTSAEGVVITLSTNTAAMLQFDLTSPVTATPSGMLDLGVGNGLPIDVVPNMSAIVIPVATPSAQAGESITISGIKVKATASGPTPVFAGNERLVIATNSAPVTLAYGDPIVVDAQTPSFTDIIADPSALKEGIVNIQFKSSETLAAIPLVKVNGRPALFVSAAGMIYSYSYAVTDQDLQGPATITIEADDVNGNSSGLVANATALTIDADLPVINSVVTQDINKNGKIDALKITFSEAIKDTTVSPANFDVAGYSDENFLPDTNGDVANDNVIYLTFSEGAVYDTGAVPTVSYTAGTLSDLAGNLLETTLTPILSVDRSGPVIVSAYTASVTSIDLTFSEQLNTVSVQKEDFAVENNTVSSVITSGNPVIGLVLGTAINPTDTPRVSIPTGRNVNDKATNRLDGPVDAPVTIDGITPQPSGPSVESVRYVEGVNEDNEVLIVSFSGPIETVGTTIDYLVEYAPSGDFTATDTRTVGPVAVSNIEKDETVEIIIPDQSARTDFAGKFRVTVSANVKDAAGNSVNQAGDNNIAVSEPVEKFDTVAPTALVVSPNGGESWRTGMTVNVTWEANDTNLGLAPIELRYSIDDFLTSELIASDLANTGTYSWTIPFISGTSAKVKVIVADIQGNIAQDISDAAFTVNSNPIFTVTPVEKSGERYIKAEWLGIGGGVEQYLISVDGNIREAITVSGNDLGVPYVRELKVLEARKYSVSVVARSMGVYAASPAVKSVLFTAPATVSSVTGVEGDGAAASDSAGARPAAPGRAQAEPPAPQPPAETPEDGETTGDENGIIRGEDQTEDEGVNWTPWIILFILIILVGAATGGYFYWFGGEEETTAATKAPAEEPKKVSEQPKSEVVRAQKKRPGGKRSKRW